MRGERIDSPIWTQLLVIGWDTDVINECINRGHVLLEYITSSNASVVRKHSFESTFDGYKVLACNTHNFSSQTFESLWDEEKYDFMVAYTQSKGKEYWVSLYTTKKGVDLSKIAASHGGGGHAQAAGFTVKKIDVNEKEIRVVL
jgi:nanoRNase/pAp phosphatase (c-di-AMP/oligoRNAs hydrolase)